MMKRILQYAVIKKKVHSFNSANWKWEREIVISSYIIYILWNTLILKLQRPVSSAFVVVFISFVGLVCDKILFLFAKSCSEV